MDKINIDLSEFSIRHIALRARAVSMEYYFRHHRVKGCLNDENNNSLRKYPQAIE